MAKFYRMTFSVMVAGVLSSMAGSALADGLTACCLGEPHTSPKGLTGLGQTAVQAANLSLSTKWSAYELERDGIQYLQVNDRSGRVRVVIGNIGETFWSLPAGGPSDRVSLPRAVLAIPAGAKRAEVYRKAHVVLAAYDVAGGIIWSIEAPDGTR